MFNLLLKVFIKNPKDTKDPKVRSMYGLLCSYISIFLNFIYNKINYRINFKKRFNYSRCF